MFSSLKGVYWLTQSDRLGPLSSSEGNSTFNENNEAKIRNLEPLLNGTCPTKFQMICHVEVGAGLFGASMDNVFNSLIKRAVSFGINKELNRFSNLRWERNVWNENLKHVRKLQQFSPTIYQNI